MLDSVTGHAGQADAGDRAARSRGAEEAPFPVPSQLTGVCAGMSVLDPHTSTEWRGPCRLRGLVLLALLPPKVTVIRAPDLNDLNIFIWKGERHDFHSP